MTDPSSYEITESVAGFSEGEILDVTARFGDWHTYDLKLERESGSSSTGTVIVTESPAGFSEREILDPTARIGDWHRRDLAFEPVGRSVVGAVEEESDSPGPITVARDQFRAIARPAD